MPNGFTTAAARCRTASTRGRWLTAWKLLMTDAISESDRAFLERRDMFFLATADAARRPTCSYKGGEPGLLRVLDPRTPAIPPAIPVSEMSSAAEV